MFVSALANDEKNVSPGTAQKVSVFGVILVGTFPHSD